MVMKLNGYERKREFDLQINWNRIHLFNIQRIFMPDGPRFTRLQQNRKNENAKITTHKKLKIKR